MATINDTDLLLVNRGGVDYKLASLDLKNKMIDDTDLLMVNRDGIDYKITAQELKEYLTPVPLPWEGHVGGIWHVNNISATMNLQKGPPFETRIVQAYDANTLADLGMISQINAGQDVVFLTDEYPSCLFTRCKGEWDFGKYTDISQVKTLQQLFFSCTNFNGKLGGNWDTSNVISLMATFIHAPVFNQDISGWDTSNVLDMVNTFSMAKAFNQPIGNWNTSKVNSMSAMFDGAEAFNQDISGWDTSNVEEMATMFLNAHAFNQDIGSWNTSKLTDMYGMFNLTSVFNQDIGRWDTSNVTSMARVFEGAKAFNQDIDNWDVSKVEKFYDMFNGASAFNQDLSNWCVTTWQSQPNYFDLDADAWTEPRPCWGHCPPKGDPCPEPSLPWEGHDGGVWHVKNLGQVPVLLGPAGSSFDSWTVDGSDQRSISQLEIGEERVIVSPPNQENMFGPDGKGGRNNNAEFEFGSYTDTSLVTNLERCFAYCGKFNGSLEGNWDTSNVTNMQGVFIEAKVFNQDISGWNTSKVTDMKYMFYYCEGFNQNIGGWDTSKVTNMPYMFCNAKAFNADISQWDVSNVPNIGAMFQGAHTFNQDISNWDVSNVTNMTWTFYEALAFNQDLSNWCVTNFTSSPDDFDKDADAWTEDRPCWGHCPPKGDPCPQPPVGLPWIGHEGGIWHIKNSNQQVRFYQGNYLLQEPCQAWTVDGTDLGLIHTMEAGEEIVFVTGDDVKELFAGGIDQNGAAQKTANWDFGEHTDTSKVTSMHSLFEYCEAFNGELGGNWDTSNVTNMHSMFHNAWYFNQDISDWDVSNVLSFKMMFDRAESFNQDISKWNTGKCEKYAMDYMFNRAKAFNQNLTEWCVDFQTFEPVSFAWRTWSTYSQPKWGSCPRGESNA